MYYINEAFLQRKLNYRCFIFSFISHTSRQAKVENLPRVENHPRVANLPKRDPFIPAAMRLLIPTILQSPQSISLMQTMAQPAAMKRRRQLTAYGERPRPRRRLDPRLLRRKDLGKRLGTNLDSCWARPRRIRSESHGTSREIRIRIRVP